MDYPPFLDLPPIMPYPPVNIEFFLTPPPLFRILKTPYPPICNQGVQTMLCLLAPPLPVNLTQSWCINSGTAQTQITSSIVGKVESTITPLEWLVAKHIIFDRNPEGKTSNITWLFVSNSCFKSLTGLGFYALRLWTPTAKATELYKISAHFTPIRCS